MKTLDEIIKDTPIEWEGLRPKLNEWAKSIAEEYADSLTPAVNESAKPMTAEGWFDNNFDCYGDSEFEVVPAMTKEVFLQYASLKPTVAEREVSDEC